MVDVALASVVSTQNPVYFRWMALSLAGDWGMIMILWNGRQQISTAEGQRGMELGASRMRVRILTNKSNEGDA